MKSVSLYELFDNDRIFVLGHRGFSEKYPENTMISYQACADLDGVDGIELDVRRCASGEIVISHDSNIKRATGVDRRIEEMTWDEIKDLDAGSFKGEGFSDARIPLFQELLSSFGDRFCYDVEIKADKGKPYKQLVLDVWQLIQDSHLESNIMVSSFNPLALRRFNKACWYSVPTADIFCTDENIIKWLRHGEGRYISGSCYLKPETSMVTEEALNKWDRYVIPWTVNTEEEAERLLSFPHVKGMIGNNPQILKEVRDRHKS
ncbi:MAG: glycerophosphodiester phosphodiesterase [Sphaerochaetaceae bacterium]|nr:glycerophosphodiester phosphodiesterase [Sphaerochaetaceae bacterium]